MQRELSRNFLEHFKFSRTFIKALTFESFKCLLKVCDKVDVQISNIQKVYGIWHMKQTHMRHILFIFETWYTFLSIWNMTDKTGCTFLAGVDFVYGCKYYYLNQRFLYIVFLFFNLTIVVLHAVGRLWLRMQVRLFQSSLRPRLSSSWLPGECICDQ